MIPDNDTIFALRNILRSKAKSWKVPGHDIDDLVSIGYVIYLELQDGEASNPVGLTITASRNRWIDLCRAERNLTFQEVSPYAKTCEAIRPSDFEALISNATQKEKEILRLKYIYGYTQKEIAYALNITQSAAGTRLSRALSKVKKSLKKGIIR